MLKNRKVLRLELLAREHAGVVAHGAEPARESFWVWELRPIRLPPLKALLYISKTAGAVMAKMRAEGKRQIWCGPLPFCMTKKTRKSGR